MTPHKEVPKEGWRSEIEKAASLVGGKADPQYVVDLEWAIDFIRRLILEARREGANSEADYILKRVQQASKDCSNACCFKAYADVGEFIKSLSRTAGEKDVTKL